MATQAASTVTGIISVAQLAICADLINEYLRSAEQVVEAPGIAGFPSTDVRTALIFALITAVWGVVMTVVVPVVHLRDMWTGAYVNGTNAASHWLLLTFIIDVISGALLAKASPHGGACIIKTARTCQLFIATVALEWIMAAFNLVGALFAAQAVQYDYAMNPPHMQAAY